jgi:hypothetical protein
MLDLHHDPTVGGGNDRIGDSPHPRARLPCDQRQAPQVTHLEISGACRLISVIECDKDERLGLKRQPVEVGQGFGRAAGCDDTDLSEPAPQGVSHVVGPGCGTDDHLYTGVMLQERRHQAGQRADHLRRQDAILNRPPRRPLTAATVSRATSSARTTSRAGPTSATPEGLSTNPRPLRMNSSVPSSDSSRRIVCVTDGWATNKCSAARSAVEIASRLVDVPVLRIDEPMASAAIESGRRIGVLATVASTLNPTVDLLRRCARRLGKDVELTPMLRDQAFTAMRSGDGARHDEIIVKALMDLAVGVDVIVLAQASMARVVATLQPGALFVPVLSSPTSGMAGSRRC